ncbi:ribosomal RNA processing protein 36 homolog [Plectropomus leopardus]|uniref:ribosomal RNA processing protein 36 homolog n=1 Tax=Plectropomus leopardus TaxID=160734 RepID=UPI001C4DC766|nr:ribosomal RNA processing protein 36 homolog [Plectropomus leopardus]
MHRDGDEEERETQQRALAVSQKKKKTMMAASSSDDEDSDVERNYALLTERGRGGAQEEERDHGGEEEEEFTDDNDDDDGEEDDEEEDGHSEASEEEDDDDDDEDDEDEDEEDEGPEDAGGSSEIRTRDDIKKELSNMSFEDIMKLQSKVGTKVYNEVAYGGGGSGVEGKRNVRSLNKNRPMEVSAKKPAPFLRQVVAVRKPTLRDPRFDDLSGEYKPEIFEKTYKFITDIKRREKEVVQKQQLKKIKTNVPRKEKLQFLLKRMENQERARLSREQQRERELQLKRQQRERANQGARPFFLKSSEKKKLQLAEKYQELKKSGKLDNFLNKKRKRNAGKDRRKLPRQLQSSNAQ